MKSSDSDKSLYSWRFISSNFPQKIRYFSILKTLWSGNLYFKERENECWDLTFGNLIILLLNIFLKILPSQVISLTRIFRTIFLSVSTSSTNMEPSDRLLMSHLMSHIHIKWWVIFEHVTEFFDQLTNLVFERELNLVEKRDEFWREKAKSRRQWR